MGDFDGLRIALSGIMAQRRGLEITGHNIANAKTEGYSRETLDLRAAQGSSRLAFFSKYPGGGFGVEVAGVLRARNQFLEARAYDDHGTSSLLTQQSSVLKKVEMMFGEPSDNGIQRQLSDFWAAWDDVANDPANLATRSQLVQRAQTITASMQKSATEFARLRDDAVEQLGAQVDKVNSLTTSIASLNQLIQNANVGRVDHNDLLDQRDLAVSKLSDLVKVTVRPADNGMVDVFTDGGGLVTGGQSSALFLDASSRSVAVRFAKDNMASNQTLGDLGGLLSSVNEVIPRYASGLDAFALKLRDAVNGALGNENGALVSSLPTSAQNQASTTGNLDFKIRLNGGAWSTVSVTPADWSGSTGASDLEDALNASLPSGVTATVTGGDGTPLRVSFAPDTATDTLEATEVGTPPNQNAGYGVFFRDVPVGRDRVGGRPFFTGTGAADLAVNADLATDPMRVAVGSAAGGPLDSSAALKLARLGESTTGPDVTYRQYITGLGVESQTTSRRASIQAAATTSVDQARDAAAGVNIDEEMVSMIAFQQAYAASARVLSAIDQALEILISRTGSAGR